MVLWLKDCLTEKKLPKKRQGVFQKTEIVLISVYLETGRYLTVVQRFEVAFIREIWSPVRDTGRFVLYIWETQDYPGELAFMR